MNIFIYGYIYIYVYIYIYIYMGTSPLAHPCFSCPYMYIERERDQVYITCIGKLNVINTNKFIYVYVYKYIYIYIMLFITSLRNNHSRDK